MCRFRPVLPLGTSPPTPVDDFLKFQILPTWREKAWRNAERLVGATSAEERAAVATDIESVATAQAWAIRDATAYNAVLKTSSERDAYCAINHDG